MKAILEQDRIIHITEQGNVEIGSIPKGVGLERLRFDGKKVVDLADLDEIWVKPLDQGFFELHVVEVLGAQLVTMAYKNRKYLVVNNNGIIRVKAVQEIENEKIEKQNRYLKNRLRQNFKHEIGEIEDQLADAYKLIHLLILAVISDDQLAKDFLTENLSNFKTTYPAEKTANHLTEIIPKIKFLMEAYYIEKGKFHD